MSKTRSRKINKDIILWDIETSYTLSATWGLYDTNVAAVIREPYILSYSWKYLGDTKTHVVALPDFKTYKKDRHNDIELVKSIRDLFDSVKVVVAHNNNQFDYRWVFGRFAIHGIKPPAPLQTIDTLLIARSKFKFNSYKLKDLGNYFGVGDKVDTGGIGLWVKCIENDDKRSWDLMKKYNKNDVVLLEKIYLKLLPFITNHPNVSLMNGNRFSCPNCGSIDINKRGISYSGCRTSQRWRCSECGSWHRSTINGVIK
jgi:predicted RNA-binding Zn-ribbon protein involved in translation (DUF1610 family)